MFERIVSNSLSRPLAFMASRLLATTALFGLFTVPAHAMPAIIGGIPALLGGLGAGGLSLGGVALGAASLGAQWLISKMLTPEQKQRGVKGRIEMGGDTSPSFIVGEYATPGKLGYRNAIDGGTNIPESLLVDDICLSCLPIDGVSTKVFIGNEGCTIDTSETFSGFYAVAEYVEGTGDGGYCSMKFHTGGQNGADGFMLDTFENDPDRPFDEDTYMPGCGEAIVRSWYSNRGIWSGWPEFRFVVRGLKLYDPRKDSSVGGSGAQRWNNENTWSFTKNPKVIEYNIIRGIHYDGKHVWGGKAEAYRLPLDYWFAAMNVCDETITKKNGDVIKRYEIGAEISLDDKPIDVINEINKSCDGFTTEFGGTYKTWCGGPGLAVGTITDDDWLITAELESNLFQSRQNTFNTCYTTYPEPRARWEVKDGPRYQDQDALDEDGEELALDLALPFVTENNQAQRLARSAIRDSRRQVTHAGQLPPRAWIFEPYDRIVYYSDMFGYDGDGKDFVISSKEDLPNVNQLVLLREMNPGDTGWLTAYEQDYDVPPLVVIKPGTLALDLDVFADEVESAAGRDKPAIRVEWDWTGARDIDVRRIDWEIRRAGTTKVIDTGVILSPKDGEALVTSKVLRFGQSYEIQFKPVPFAIRDSVWTDWKPVTMDAVEVPAAPGLTKVSELGDDGKLDYFVDVDWVAVAQDATYEIRAVVGAKTLYYPSAGVGRRIPVISSKSYTIAVRAIGADGTPGAWSATASITVTKKNTAPTTPTELTVVGKHRRAVVKTEDHPDKDFRRWNFYYSTTNLFSSAAKTKHSRSNRFVLDDLANGTTYYGWLTAEDTSGNESAKYPSGNTAGVSFATAKIDDDDTEDGVLAAPTGLTLTKVQDTDEDGSVRTFIKMACTAPAWATAKTTYVFAITVGSDTFTVKSDDEIARYRVQKTGVLHTVKVRAVKGHGNKGNWSGNSTITPTKKSSTASAITGVTSHKKNGDIIVKWNAVADPDNREVIVKRATTNSYGAAVEIARTKANRYRDSDVNTKNTTYYYFVDPVDTSGNVGAASASTSQTETGIGTSDTDAAALAAPTGISLTQADRDVNADGTVDTAMRTTFSGGVAGAAGYEVWWEDDAGQSATARADSGSWWFMANTERSYRVRWRTINWVGTPGAWSSYSIYVSPAPTTGAPPNATGISVSSRGPLTIRASWTVPTNLDYSHSEVSVTNVSGAYGYSVGSTSVGQMLIPVDAAGTWQVGVRHVNTSKLASPSIIDSSNVVISGVDRSDLEAGAGGAIAHSNSGTTIGSVNAGAATRTLLTLSFKMTSNTAGVTIDLGSYSTTIDFVSGLQATFTTSEAGGGSFNGSKSGGSISGCQLTAVGVH